MSGITAWVDVPMYEKRVVNYGEETKMIRELVPEISKLREELKDDIIVYMREHVVQINYHCNVCGFYAFEP